MKNMKNMKNIKSIKNIKNKKSTKKSVKKPFTEWEPAISPKQVFSNIIMLSEIHIENGNVYWLEKRPFERGRYVIVRRDGNGQIKDITPSGFNVRTRVHEYGGGSYAIFKNSIYFVNFKDQRIYHQLEDSSKVHKIHPITPSKNKDGSLGKYASLEVSPDGKKLLFVYEKEYSNKENENFLGVLDLDSKQISEPKIIAKGYDFYADPIFSPDGKRIAYLQWNHPDMPWDSTELMIGRFEKNKLVNVKKIDGGKNKSICLPKFDREGRLYYVMDKAINDPLLPENWWNIYRYTDEIDRKKSRKKSKKYNTKIDIKIAKIEQITSENAEFAEPHWVFGQSNYDFLSDNRIVAKILKNEKEYLIIIEPEKKSISLVNNLVKNNLYNYDSIRTDVEGKVFFIASSSKESAAIYSLNINSGDNSGEPKVLRKSSKLKMQIGDISLPKAITYPTKDGEKSHAFFYLPKNSRFIAPQDDKPPLLVMAHGGPTSRTDSSFSFVFQFWTSSGFAVVDVNYRGSTGYGRKYRDKLLSKWGIIDTEDVADAVRYLIKKKKIDPNKVAISGGSAGGYIVQRAMTEYPDLFKVGASYYGIGNLITLAKQTHKFESRYIDNLVGAKLPQGKKEYMNRSPIYHLDKLNSPMIIFQGSDDKIVAPECSREMAKLLAKKGIKYKYIEYKGEAHGFRVKKNIVDSLNKEFAFYRSVFV